MLKILLLENTLRILVNDLIFKPRHKSQMRYWEFDWNPEDNLFETKQGVEISAILPKIINYFNRNKILFELSPECQEIIQEIRLKKKEFENFIYEGRIFKDGNFNKKDYADHLSYLEKNIFRELREHQKKAYYHLYKIKNGANFSVPGSGKTTVVLSVYEKLKKENKVNTLFVVGPPSCFGPWKEEFETVLNRDSKAIILAGGNRTARKMEYYNSYSPSELYLCTFHTLFNDQREIIDFLRNNKTSVFLIIDEAHYIKKINGNWATAVLNIAEYAKFRCVLTGTPIPKSYSDLFNLFEFLWPKNEILSDTEKLMLEECESSKDYKQAGEILEPKTGPLFYRVRKSELGLKPQVFNKPYQIEMNPNERKIYDAIITKIKDYAKEDYFQNIDFIIKLIRGRMTRLRQCLSYTGLLKSAIEGYDEDLKLGNDLIAIVNNYDKLEAPAKLKFLLDMIDELNINGKKVVVWAHFIGTINLIEKTLLDSGYYCKKIIGETPIERLSIGEADTREKIRNEFVDKGSGLEILIANPAACAESISLHKTCQNAIYYDLSYNGAQYLQSLDRIHRVGGSETKEAYYHFLQYADTFENAILENLKDKARKMYQIIEGDYNIYSLDMSEEGDEVGLYKKLLNDD